METKRRTNQRFMKLKCVNKPGNKGLAFAVSM
jgi:hypothetical protein